MPRRDDLFHACCARCCAHACIISRSTVTKKGSCSRGDRQRLEFVLQCKRLRLDKALRRTSQTRLNVRIEICLEVEFLQLVQSFLRQVEWCRQGRNVFQEPRSRIWNSEMLEYLRHEVGGRQEDSRHSCNQLSSTKGAVDVPCPVNPAARNWAFFPGTGPTKGKLSTLHP